MSRKTHTTVILTDSAQKIKMELTPIYGLKNILSAGLILLGQLSAEERQEVISKANDTIYNDPEEKIRKLKKLLSLIENSEYKIPSKEESALIRDLRKELGPKPKKLKRKTKEG